MSEKVRRKLIEDATYFHSCGWMMGTAGNLSGRHQANAFWITASGCDKGALKLIDFVEVDLSGEAKSKFRIDAKPSAETSLHQAIYKHVKTAGAVYHVHSVEANIASHFTDAGFLKLPELEMLKAFYGIDLKHAAIPVLENHDNVPDIAVEIENLLKQDSARFPAVLIKNHGVTVWAENQKTARNYVELIEYIFKFMVMKCQDSS